MTKLPVESELAQQLPIQDRTLPPQVQPARKHLIWQQSLATTEGEVPDANRERSSWRIGTKDHGQSGLISFGWLVTGNLYGQL